MPGSLIIGGYDQSRFSASGLNIPIGGFKDRSLPLSIQSIVAENTLANIISMTSEEKGIDVIIDSTVAQLWLPQSVCDLFAQAFGLTYDSGPGLYLMNNTIHDQLKQLNPTVTFAVGGAASSGPNTNIVLPYAAFDLEYGLPLFNSSTRYFPLKVAANESQQVLGRTFLQEAYVFADWERKNFTIGQAIHQNATMDIVKVLPPLPDPSSSMLTTGMLVGMVLGICAIIALVIGLAIFIVRRARRNRIAEPHVGMTPPPALQGDTVRVHEVDVVQAKHELLCTQISELRAESVERELEGDIEWRGRAKNKHDVFELP